MSLARYIVAGLGAAASVSGMPTNSSTQTSTSTLSTVYGTATAPSTPNIAAADAATLGKAVAGELTNVGKFNQLLTVDGAGKELLSADIVRQRTVFDFNQAPATGAGGKILQANVGTFPLLVDERLSTAVVFLEPCGMNSPHTHPRAAEWLTVVEGSIRTGFMLENTFLANKTTGQLTTDIDNVLGAFQGTLFPMGSIHFQFNDNCAPATLVATLNSEDPGTSQIAQNFFFQDDDVVEVALGDVLNINGKNIDQFASALPPNLIQAMTSCLAKCNL